jgi:ABC-2 type transport system ATP-binding protein
MAILSVLNLTKKFGDFKAVDDISFKMKEGEILGFLGPNGAGKTTTIQMLLGILTPTAGDINYFGKSLFKHREEILEDINFSTSYTSPPWNLKVIGNLNFTAYLYDIPDRKRRIKEIIEIFKLQDLLHKFARELSAGQTTRLNLARAFINTPRVLLLDEPTASLDPDIAKYVRSFLFSERKKSNISILLTSHNMREVEEICDRVVFIQGGKIVADDTPDGLMARIDTSHVELYVKDGLNRLKEYASKQRLKIKINGRYITVDVAEKQIAKFLQEITAKGIIFSEISIDKPNLDDYFVAMSKNKK